MNEALSRMMARYECRRLEDYVRALREIIQELALLGLWRSRFFERAAFYGGTSLRILYGLDRFSEDLDFSLLKPMPGFVLSRYGEALKTEIESFGFKVTMTAREGEKKRPIQSAFLKADTLGQLLVIETGETVLRELPRGQVLKVKIEVDTDPPSGFGTEVRYLLHPIPFSVRTYLPADLFAGKMHAVLCRRWKHRVKGRDWYDLVWFAANHPKLNLAHLEQRMRQSGDFPPDQPLTKEGFRALLTEAIERVDVDQTRHEVIPFVKNPESLTVWSRPFFHDVARRIEII